MTSYARNHAPVNISPGVHSHQHPHFASGPSQHMPVHGHGQRRHRFVTDLSQCLLDFVVQLLPTAEELAVKEDVRKLLERLIRTIEVDSRLLSFGSTANGFSLRNSDMDLCCLIDSEERLSATDLVTMVGDLLERETKFHVKPLPHARIPIVKLSLDPSPGLPLGIACDIGFENRLALENTRLLLCYSMVDPTRVRTLVLFLKVWSKRRKINSPYQGTLSSYGYVLLVIYFLVHVKNPPVLPNLQQIPPLRPIPAEEYHMGERNIWFFDDIELLRQKWKSSNTESVAELLIDFFRYYARDFSYNTGVASIRAGLLKKDVKGWQNDTDPRFKDGRERNRLCIEDPFEVDYNVARCVTKDGLYLIRGEFMRASRILQVRPERAYYALAQLCEERDESVMKLTAAHNTLYVPPRLSFPPQTPYSIGSNSFRPNSTSERERLSPLLRPLAEDTPTIPPHVHSKIPPEHMAPKRTKWTSPPPPEAPDADRSSFESRLGFGLSLATAATDARELEKAYQSSSSNSEILSDDGDIHSDIALDDDVKSVRSFTGEPSTQLLLEHPEEARLPFSPSSSVPHRLSEVFSAGAPLYMMYQQAKTRSQIEAMPTSFAPTHAHGKSDGLRRSNSGPARAGNAAGPRVHLSPSAQIPLPFNVPLPPSPVHTAPHSATSSPTIYYETNVHRMPNAAYTTSSSTPSSPVNPPPMYQQQYHVAHAHAQAQAQAYGQSHQVSEVSSSLARSMDDSPGLDRRPTKPADSKPASPMMQSPSSPTARPLHVHTHSNSTIVGPRTPAASSFSLAQIQTQSTSSLSQQSSPSHSPSFPHASLMRLPALPAISSNYTSPRSIIPSAYGSSPRLFSANVSSPQPGSPHLSSHLPHLERRQSQSGISSQSVQSQAQLPVSGLSTTTGASLAFDLASPAVSPVSSASASSHGGSASGSASIASVSAGSGGSKSPFSSTSPRAADLSSPRAPSPERRLHKQAHELPPHPHQPSHREHNSQSQYQHSHNQSHPSFGVPRPGKITRPVRARVPLTSGREDATPGETERTNESGLSEVLSPRSPCLPRAHPNAPQGTEQSGSVEREVSPISEPAVSGSQEFKLAVDTEGHRVVEKASESLMSTSEVTESMGEERVSESVEKILVQAH